MLLAATASLWFFYLLLRRIGGERAALIGCALLATDSAYLLTACFDWGPVALQHLLLVGGMLLLVRFYQQRGPGTLFAGFLCLGLALWDKALAMWMLTGMGVAALLVFPRQIVRVATGRRMVIAVLAFVIGALPLLVYNATHHWDTFHGNFRPDLGDMPGKAGMVMATASTGGLFGWLTEEDWKTVAPHAPRSALARLSAKISSLDGDIRQQALLYLFALALLVAPLARGNDLRAILFALVTGVVAWTQMAITAGAGGSIHHTILLWPLPEMVIALSLASASRRLGRAGIPALAVVLGISLISGALVINEYFTKMVRNGGAQAWDDAIFALAGYLKQVPAKTVISMDWGIMDPLRLLGAGRLPLAMGSEQVSKPEMNEGDRAIVERMISSPDNVFIAHTKPFEFFPGNAAKLVKYAADRGYRRQDLATISDTYGRPVFEIFRLMPEAERNRTGQ